MHRVVDHEGSEPRPGEGQDRRGGAERDADLGAAQGVGQAAGGEHDQEDRELVPECPGQQHTAQLLSGRTYHNY